jgi:hypothetical protein
MAQCNDKELWFTVPTKVATNCIIALGNIAIVQRVEFGPITKLIFRNQTEYQLAKDEVYSDFDKSGCKME